MKETKKVPAELRKILKDIKEFWKDHPGSYMHAVSAYMTISTVLELKSKNKMSVNFFSNELRKFETDISGYLVKTERKHLILRLQSDVNRCLNVEKEERMHHVQDVEHIAKKFLSVSQIPVVQASPAYAEEIN